MQYLLTEDEFERLAPKREYTNLLHSVNELSETVVNHICSRNINSSNYCDDWPIRDVWIAGRGTNIRFCKKPKNFSK